MLTKSTLSGLLSGLLLLSGCTVYMEQETPAGLVPPQQAPPVVQPTMEQGLQSVFVSNLHPEGEQYLGTGTSGGDNARTLEDFQSAYITAGRPRIAIYFNRLLSDDASGWQNRERLVDNFQVNAQTKRKDFTAAGVETLEYQTATEDSRREGVDEAWDWSFEEGFVAPFMTANSTIVDRATILRLAGAVNSGSNPSRRTVEMEALKNYADVFVELLIAEHGVKASVKDVATGTILASATAKEGDPRCGQQYVATAEGFQPSGYGPHEWGCVLANKIMLSLAKRWGR